MVKDEVKSGRTSDWKRHLFQDVLSRERQRDSQMETFRKYAMKLLQFNLKKFIPPPQKKNKKNYYNVNKSL